MPPEEAKRRSLGYDNGAVIIIPQVILYIKSTRGCVCHIPRVLKITTYIDNIHVISMCLWHPPPGVLYVLFICRGLRRCYPLCGCYLSGIAGASFPALRVLITGGVDARKLCGCSFVLNEGMWILGLWICGFVDL